MAQLFKIIFIFLLLFSSLKAKTYSSDEIKKLIGKTIIIGFDTQTLNSELKKNIDEYNLGGVILFNKDYKTKKEKNIHSKKQLKKLIDDIQNYSSYKMFISIDQEGGKVQRLNSKNGFTDYPSATFLGSKDEEFTKNIYNNLSKELNNLGINLNFAPVVDVAVNSKNHVIVGLQRSYSNDAKSVTKYASIFIGEMNKNNVYSVLKHFPGHGSSTSDSHKGFVDITNTWQEKELIPYEDLIKKNKAKFIMTAHVFNKKLDNTYPATLSYNINTKLLRKKLNFKGLIISDDLQMKAISSQYNLRQTLKLAINSGVNILLFGNQLDNVKLKTIVDTVHDLILKKEIDLSKIIYSNKLIEEYINNKISK